MPFHPTLKDLVTRSRADLRSGLPVVVVGEQAWFVFAAETIDPDRLKTLYSFAEQASLVVTDKRAQTLKAQVYDGDIARLVLPKECSLRWVHAVADPASDLANPMKGPFKSQRGGSVSTHRAAIRLVKSARLLPAVVMAPVDHHDTSGLTVLPAEAMPEATKSAHYRDVISAALPMAVSSNGRVHVFRPDDGSEEHYAIEIGTPDPRKPVLTRLHSACFTGDLLGSLKCDCGPQLRGAMAQMGAEGAGVLLYLNQEGRGIGLANKMRAYSLQDEGFDTVEANHRLGFEDDERDFRIGSAILKRLGISDVRLLTNNPAKIARMEETGIKVSERVALKHGENPFNVEYLRTKAAKSGHLL
ncbi:GTP cyclohydrolase II [Nereida sp. MMG025]|uniref:GTP cyclohydrolase II n=1 Tax=Nereida sp. MMG025 TaxID=2909981 RepID=UPI001F0329F4|nr:GTP cyclohydrolase II [Nereida sp. MMG025]MCF6444784.1 GTP cyclohydrolase II [Nereida sp. MMG025]